jgi:filamentous hemagglutinin family protein
MSHKPRPSRRENKRNGILFLISGFLWSHGVIANPILDHVASGSVQIQQSANSTTVQQSSQKAIIEWESFNLGANESAHFQQPQGGIALNRINSNQGASEIYGQITATGQIILINQAGIYFGPNSSVNVGSVIASTSNISNDNFLNNNYAFNQPSTYSGSIINDGSIIASQYGLVALLGTAVANNGTIQAELGTVALDAGSKFAISFSGNNLINFTVETAATAGVDNNGHTVNFGVSNTGILSAGKIIVTANTASQVLDHAINMGGVVVATTVVQQGGAIILTSEKGKINAAGEMVAKGNYPGQKGGQIKLFAQNILVSSQAKLNVSGNAGGGSILIGGNLHGAGPDMNALKTTVAAGAIIKADALNVGNGGQIVVWSNNDTQFNGSISSQGGPLGGNGGYVETSGGYLNVTGAQVNTSASHGQMGSWLLDPTTIWIANSSSNAISAGMPASGTGNSSCAGGTCAESTAISNSLLMVSTLTTALDSSNVIVTTSNSNGLGAGNITVVDPLSWDTNNNLTLSAYGNIILNADITNTAGANVTLIADNSGSWNSYAGTGTMGKVCGGGNSLCGGAPSGVVSLSGGSGIVSIYYDPTTFGVPEVAYNDGTTPTAYMLINELGSNFDSATINSLGALSNNSSLWSQNLNFALGADIDGSDTTSWNGNSGFSPIGDNSTPFNGNFDGQSHVISNLYLNTNATYAGLFGLVSGSISNVGLTNINLTADSFSSSYIGGLVGELDGGSLTNVFVTGEINQHGYYGNIYYLGGLVGYMHNGSITNVYNISNINTNSDTYNPYYIGGLVGYMDNVSMTSSHNTGSVNANAYYTLYYAGGLVGHMHNGSSITDSYSTGGINVNSQAQVNIGGLAGEIKHSSIINSYNIGSITTYYSANFTGGLVGYMDSGSNITDSYNAGSMNLSTSNNGNYIGGLVGCIGNASITNSYNTGAITISSSGSTNSNRVGGLVGYMYGTSIINSYNTSSINISSSDYSDNVGGLVGYMEAISSITNAYNTGSIDISNANNNYAGGLVGFMNNASIMDTYNQGDIYVGTNSYVGGLVGKFGTSNSTTIQNSYNTGAVTGSGSLGGLVGENSGPNSVIINSFWDVNTSGQTNGAGSGSSISSGATGETTADMMTETTFCNSGNCSGGNSGFDFANVWGIISGSSYPFLTALCTSQSACAAQPVTQPTANLNSNSIVAKIITGAGNGIINNQFSNEKVHGLWFHQPINLTSLFFNFINIINAQEMLDTSLKNDGLKKIAKSGKRVIFQ